MTLNRQRIKHRFTRTYTPRTNGKAERFIQTAFRDHDSSAGLTGQEISQH